MEPTRVKYGIVSFITISLVVLSLFSPAHAREKKEKTLRIKWESIAGIIKYIVNIKDAGEKVVLDRTVENNYIDFILPPGKYQIRIGAINKFEKISFWTDWEEIEIRKSVRTKFFANKFPAEAGLKISGGACYNMLLPYWNSLYKDSVFNLKYLGYMGSVGFHFGDMTSLKRKGFVRFMGIELEAKYCIYAGKNIYKDNSRFVSQLDIISGGPNIFFKTRLEFPINFYLRIGGGATYTIQKYSKLTYYFGPQQFLPDNGKIASLDPYAKVGVSIEFNFLYALSLNVGTDYHIQFYKNKLFHSLHYYAMLGIRI